MLKKRPIKRILGGLLISGAMVFSMTTASAGPPSFEEKIEYGNGNSVTVCIRVNLSCPPIRLSG